MERIIEKYHKKVNRTTTDFKRYLLSGIDWKNRLIGIKGARGAGKTTMLLQYIKENLPPDHQTLYVSLDDLYFTENKLVDLVDVFVKRGGRFLLLDEVHRYPEWSKELKNIYDDYDELKIIFTGSSVIHLDKAKGDLSRRAVMYELLGLSYREYLNFTLNQNFEPIELGELLKKHTEFAKEIALKIRPLEYFNRYLQMGYYPYFMENERSYHEKLVETISLALSTDLPSFYNISYASIEKIRLLIYVLAESVPFIPNISKLSERIGVTRSTLLHFLMYLEDLRILRRLFSSTRGISLLQKPEKLYLHHPNLHYALSNENPDIGSIRESFFANQVGTVSPLTYPKKGDFKTRDFTFEIGGKNKTNGQIKEIPDSYVAADNLEIGFQHKIPIWLFGFLY